MGLKLERKKKKHYLLRFIFNIFKFRILSKEKRIKLFLDLEWIFNRLAHEESYKLFSNECHPVRIATIDFLTNKITASNSVFDLGCNSGDLSVLISEFSKNVVGVDYNKQLIENANRKYQRNNLSFICEEASMFLNKNKDKFDVLILSHILEHLDNPEEFLLKFKNFFKFVYIELPDFESSFSNSYRLKVKSDLIYTDLDHVSEFDRIEICEILKNCKIKIIESEFKFGFQKYWCEIL
jgi:SAM-dependent methyltransferase